MNLTQLQIEIGFQFSYIVYSTTLFHNWFTFNMCKFFALPLCTYGGITGLDSPLLGGGQERLHQEIILGFYCSKNKKFFENFMQQIH